MIKCTNALKGLIGVLLLVSCASTSKHEAADHSSRMVANAAGLKFRMKHTVQVCKHPGHQPTWCDGGAGDDIKNSIKAGGLETDIIDQLDRALINPKKSRVFAAEFSFSDKPIQAKVCELGKAGVDVVIVLDHGSSDNLEFASACQANPTKPNLRTITLGGFTDYPEWRLHHNKTVMVDPGDGSDFNIDFSSGNLSTFGVSLHMDHWVMITAPGTSNIVRATQCLFKGLMSADDKATQLGMYVSTPDWSKEPEVMKTYKNARDNCLKANNVIPMYKPEEAIEAEGIAPFFTPNGRLAQTTLVNEIKKITEAHKPNAPGYIYVAIEHFSNQAVASALNKAATAGVDVRIIMNSGTVSGGTEVASDAPFYYKNLKPGKIKIRFIETNPKAGGSGQQMHNKFAILNGKRIFSGAGHYTNSGLETNFETHYLTQDEKLSKDYAKYFKELWELSVNETYLTENKPLTKAPAFEDDFLDLAK